MRALRYVSALLVSIETTMSASTPAVMVCSFGTLPPTTRVSHRSRTNSYTPRITPMHWAAVPTLPEQMNALAARSFICSGNVGTAAQCIGVMRGVYELVRDRCDTRVVGGKVPKEHTITAGVLADIVVSIETSRAETYLKARMLDQPEV